MPTARTLSASAALMIDAVGCLVGACIFLLSTTAWGWTDLPADWRLPVVVALFGFSGLLVFATRYQTRWLIALAVLGNIGWITGGAVALFVTDTWLGGVIIAVVMLADAIMAWLQAKPLTYDKALHTTTKH